MRALAVSSWVLVESKDSGQMGCALLEQEIRKKCYMCGVMCRSPQL